jgi:hypothetical protein
MKKLTTLFAIAAMSTGLAIAGCKKDPAATKEAPVAKPTDTRAAEPQTTDITTTKPATPAATPTATIEPATAGTVPAECTEYKAGIEKLAACEKLPKETRDTLKAAYEQSSASWASVPPEGRATLATTCKNGVDALKQVAASCQ